MAVYRWLLLAAAGAACAAPLEDAWAMAGLDEYNMSQPVRNLTVDPGLFLSDYRLTTDLPGCQQACLSLIGCGGCLFDQSDGSNGTCQLFARVQRAKQTGIRDGEGPEVSFKCFLGGCGADLPVVFGMNESFANDSNPNVPIPLHSAFDVPSRVLQVGWKEDGCMALRILSAVPWSESAPGLLTCVVVGLQQLHRELRAKGISLCAEVRTVGWRAIDYYNVSNVREDKIPDLFIMGTTQVARMAEEGVLVSLNSLLDELTLKGGMPRTDDIVSRLLEVYLVGRDFMALPLLTDYRLLFYNVTSLRDASLERPPPDPDHGQDPGEDFTLKWSWSLFTSHVDAVTKLGRGYGYRLNPGWDEEIKIISTMAREPWGVVVAYKEDMSHSVFRCGLDTPEFRLAMASTVLKMWKYDQSADPNWYPKNDTMLKYWMSKYPANNLSFPPFGEFDAIWDTYTPETPLIGFEMMSPMTFAQRYRNTTLKGMDEGEIGMAYVPGLTSYLGGVGIGLSSKARYPSTAFRLIDMLTDPNGRLSRALSVLSECAPPWESLLMEYPWGLPENQIHTQTLLHSLPIEYPYSSTPGMGNLELSKPLRTFLCDLLLMNSTLDFAIERACTTIVNTLLPVCSFSDYEQAEPGNCNPDHQMPVPFQWKQPKACTGGVLPAPVMVPCPKMECSSTAAIVSNVIASLGLILCLYLLSLLIYHRNERPISRDEPILHGAIAVGSALSYVSTYTMCLPASHSACAALMWLALWGGALIFSATNLRLFRVWEIFVAASQKAVISPRWTLLRLLGIMLPPTITLIAASALGELVTQEFASGGREETLVVVPVVVCYSGNMGLLLILCWDLVLMIAALFLCCLLRRAPASVPRMELTGLAVGTCLAALVVVWPILASSSTSTRYVMLAALLLYNTTVTLVLCVAMRIVVLPQRVSNTRLHERGRRLLLQIRQLSNHSTSHTNQSGEDSSTTLNFDDRLSTFELELLGDNEALRAQLNKLETELVLLRQRAGVSSRASARPSYQSRGSGSARSSVGSMSSWLTAPSQLFNLRMGASGVTYEPHGGEEDLDE